MITFLGNLGLIITFIIEQSGEAGNPPPVLAHHLSLPKTSAEISAIDKFFQFQDSVPCKIRAKRGCATHPRSIAERVKSIPNHKL